MLHLFRHLDDNFDHDLSGNLDVDIDDSLDLICGDLLLLATYISHSRFGLYFYSNLYRRAPRGARAL